jgi:hypothetical protein
MNVSREYMDILRMGSGKIFNPYLNVYSVLLCF